MAVQPVPHITLTDPHNNDSAPSPAQSPIKGANGGQYLGVDGGGDRPITPPGSTISTEGRVSSDAGASARPGTSSSNRSSKLRRASSNGSSQRQQSNGDSGESQAHMDPLSQHILKRTNTPNHTPTVRRPPTPESPDKDEISSAPAVQSPSTSRQDGPTHAQRELKKGVKAVSFLSKLIGNKKREEEPMIDDTSSISEQRQEGHNAEIFAQPLDSMGYNPHHASPPAYIKVRSRHKPKRDFDRLFLAQHLHCKSPNRLQRTESNKLRRKTSVAQTQGENTVWAMEFSRDGQYLAAAGADMIVRVWKVLSSSDDRQQHEMQEKEDAGGLHEHLSAPVFQSKPIHEFQGHTSTVLDLSWSKNNFLLSSSMDKTVRLWHISRSECLCTFKHHDFVPSICFHPKDDRFFLAGSLDSKLRLWSIPDKSVAYIAQLPDLITAVAFTPDGRSAVAGCLSGLCMFFETEGLKYSTQIHVRSTRGQNARGSKITGIQAHQSHSGETKLLITSNDSRVRLYNFRDKSLELKFKGNENNCSQIRATLSDDGKYVACGSEDNKAYVWSLGSVEGDGVRREKRPLEMFEAHDTIATVVCFAPAKTKHLLSKSEDPIFDLCNPPPVMLMSRHENAGVTESHNSSNPSRPASLAGSIQHTPAEAEGVFPHHQQAVRKPEYSPAYISRSGHKEGNIIVTADYNGNIKVFRQDCAWNKRRSEDWDRVSLFSKRASRSATGMTRAGSITTKASQPSLRDPRTSMSSEGGSGGPAARIMTWRQGVSSSPSIAEGAAAKRRENGGVAAASSGDNSSGNASPSKSPSLMDRRGSLLKTQAKTGPETELSYSSTSPAPETSSNKLKRPSTAQPAHTFRSATIDDKDFFDGQTREENPLLLHGGRSYQFWDTEEWRERARAARGTRRPSPTPSPSSSTAGAAIEQSTSLNGADSTHLGVGSRPGLGTNGRESFVSRLSDEIEPYPTDNSDGDDDGFEDAQEGFDNLDEDTAKAEATARQQQKMYCRSCGGEAFTASRGERGNMVLVCGSCGHKA